MADIKSILNEINSNENQTRKRTSHIQKEIYDDVIDKHVKSFLTGLYDSKTVDEMSVISSINLCRKIVKKEASLYINEPKRTFTGLTPDQESVIKEVYRDLNINNAMLKANIYYKLQDQHHIQIVPYDGELKLKLLLSHRIDAIPDPVDPTEAKAYILSGYSRALELQNVNSDGQNQTIADNEDYQAIKSHVFWSEKQNFITDENGAILTDTVNELGMMPIVDICGDKDDTYFKRPSTALADFTIQFNAAMTDLYHIMRMQGFSVAVLSGNADMMPKSINAGVNKVLLLPVDPNAPTPTDFKFVSPTPDLAGSIQVIESLLASFLTSRGLDASEVSFKGDVKQFASGMERLLYMIDSFTASKEDIALFQEVEEEIFEVIIAYLNTYSGTEVLKYKVAPINEENVSINVQFHKPEIVQTETDKLDIIQRKIELGLMTKAEAIAYDRGIEIDEAVKVQETIDKDLFGQQPVFNTNQAIPS